MKFILIAAALLFNITACVADTCEDGRGIKTPFGRLTVNECVDSHGYTTNKSVVLEQRKILTSKYLSNDLAIDKGRTHWVYYGESSQVTGCAEKLYLVDLSQSPVKVLAFGVKGACNEFNWASWGEKRSVIALKKNVSFVYENGKLTPPKAGEQLWKSIEPPHAGPGLKVEDAIPFVEELPLSPAR